MMLTLIKELSFVVLVLLVYVGWIFSRIFSTVFRYELEDHHKRKVEKPIAVQKLSLTGGERLKSEYIINLYMKDEQQYHDMIVGAITEEALYGYFRPYVPSYSKPYQWNDVDHIEIIGKNSSYFSSKPNEDTLKVGV